VPCGIADARYGVTSLADLGRATTLAEADAALRAAFDATFGETVEESEAA
jgi:lipoyl(octanoyl) transferase